VSITYKQLSPIKYVAMDGDRAIAHATVDLEGNYVRSIFVSLGYRRRGVGTGMISFITASRGKQLNRAPSAIKNDKVKQMSVKLGPILGPEAELK
jgi:hypothetical protein